MASEEFPTSIINSKACHKFRRININLCRREIRDDMLVMNELVEKKMVDLVDNASRGSILHDGWTKHSALCVAAIACFFCQNT